jgi:hypothetical protein
LTSPLVGGERSASRLGRFTPGVIPPGSHFIGWVDPRARLDEVQKREFLSYQDSNPGPSDMQHVGSPFSDRLASARAVAEQKVVPSSAFVRWAAGHRCVCLAGCLSHGLLGACQVTQRPRLERRNSMLCRVEARFMFAALTRVRIIIIIIIIV